VSRWKSAKARRVLAALHRIGWHELRKTGSHRVLVKNGQRYIFPFHEGDEIGPRMLARIAKHTGLKPEDL
jgi:predicted RNA binding protein YcfA (HicA-like mRNA interferase family)